MDKIKLIFTKNRPVVWLTNEVGDKSDKSDDQINHDIETQCDDYDLPRLEGVDTVELYEPEYNNQVQTEVFVRRPEPSSVEADIWGSSRVGSNSVPRTRMWGIPTSDLQVQTQQLDFRPAQTEDTKMIYVDEEDIDAISTDVAILNEIARDMAIMLDVQGENLDKIDTHVDSSTRHVEAATEEVKETMRYMKKMNYKKGVITTTGCAAIGGAIGVLGGPPGIAIGAGIGGAVGLVGSTISSIVERTL